MEKQICYLCKQTLGGGSEATRIPIFDATRIKNPKKIVPFMGKLVHATCWAHWDLWEDVCRISVQTLDDEFEAGICFANGGICGAWGFDNKDPSFAHGALFLPRSGYFFDNILGIDINGCELRGRTENLRRLIGVLTNETMSQGMDLYINEYNGCPDLKIDCTEENSDYVKLQLSSSSEYGFNNNCFFFQEDIALLKESLNMKIDYFLL